MKRKITKLVLVILGLFVLTPAMAQTVNMDRWIDLTVVQGEYIRLDFIGHYENTGIRIISGSYDTTFTIGNVLIGQNLYFADSSNMRIYGDIKSFECMYNWDKITGLDASNNIALMQLFCFNNSITNLNISGLNYLQFLKCSNNAITNLDASGLTSLTNLYCNNNSLTSLNLSGLIFLEDLDCSDNSLISLDLSGLTYLTTLNCRDNSLTNINLSGLSSLNGLYCQNNALTNLDVRNLTALTMLNCYNNSITSLITSGCTNLNNISCYENELSACALDSVFHQLPNLQDSFYPGRIYIKNDSVTNPGTSTCRDTIARNRNWEVRDYSDTLVIINTNYSCPYFTLDIEELDIDNISAKVYPNPVSSSLNIECSEKINSIIFYDTFGKELFRTKETKDIDVSTLTEGVYFLKLITNKGEGSYKVIKQ